MQTGWKITLIVAGIIAALFFGYLLGGIGGYQVGLEECYEQMYRYW